MTIRERKMNAGTVGSFHAWKGVIRDGRDVVWICEHIHRNRDFGGRYCPVSARRCAENELLRRERKQESE